MIDLNEVSTSLAATAGWDKMSAYERAKLACGALTRAGAAVPSWTTIRDIIGKGSAGDINRAKKDFRLEHADTLRKLEGFSADGVPQSLTPYVVGLWREAISHAQRAFADKERVWEEEVEQAVAGHQHAEAELERAQAAAHAMQAKIDGLEQARLALQEQLQSEQAARIQAEKMIDQIRADLVGQRNRLDAALANAQTELGKAITRLEATEKRSMMEIERARQDAAQKIADANARLKGEQDKLLLETTRLSKQLQDGRDNAKRIQDRNIVLERENRTLIDRAQRAEARANDLQEQNAKLLAKLGKPEFGSGRGIVRRLRRKKGQRALPGTNRS
ncbi:DNA-binding protein [Bordetella flabilis]|uniref:KfrA N-terminal DNA-binding domain-containing protein n=1 Tax=Bordetella flabilis TaxID=463014 RepID=A0A193GL77_9BORD|nr:DNA-binding protein [Bordetella flabilis]ANN80847.1 hypothetical protein BAU07_26355 [Bordetella flabilis]